jgi:hypothetical protein
MLEKDKIKKCKVFDKYFTDEIEIAKIETVSGGSSINIFNSANASTSIDMSYIKNKIIALINAVPNVIQDVWYPVFVDSANSDIKYKTLSRNGAIRSNPIGLEDIISFTPTFKTITINGDAKMSIDWILNSLVTPFMPEYGVLFWFKKSNLAQIVGAGTSGFTLEKIPIGGVVSPKASLSYTVPVANGTVNVSINTTTKLVKIDNNKLYILNPSPLKYNNADNTVSPSNIIDFFDLDSYIQQKKSTTINSNTIFFTLHNSSSFGNDIQLWVPNGETYSYYVSDEIKNNDYTNGVALKSYLSPVLYPQYREIYNLLTYGIDRKFKTEGIPEDNNFKIVPKPLLSLKQSRLLKKLAHCLATGPLLDRVGNDVLNNPLITKTLNNIVIEYINSVVSNVLTEQTALKTAILKIYKLFKNYQSVDDYTLGSSPTKLNFVSDVKDLFRILWFKYGASLRIKTSATINLPSSILKYGPNFKLNHDVISKCDKNINNTSSYHNLTITAYPLVAKTQISDNDTVFVTSNRIGSSDDKIIQLGDIERKRLLTDSASVNFIDISAGPDIEIQFPDIDPDNPTAIRELVHPLDDATTEVDTFLNTESIFSLEPVSIEWSKIAGSDCLRFSDNNLSRGSLSYTTRFVTSTQANPDLYIKKPGKYILQLKATHSLGIVFLTKVIHVIDPDPEGYQRPTTELLRSGATERIGIESGHFVLCPNLREFAFDKYGGFWPMYSDLTVKVENALANEKKYEMFGGAIKRYDFPTNAIFVQRLPTLGNTQISLRYECTSSIVDIKRIIVSYMSDNNDDCAQCLSFHEYIIDSKATAINANNYMSTNKTKIYSYGNFSPSIISGLQINIPRHPAPGTILPPVTGVEPNYLTSLNNPAVKPVCRQDYIHYSGGIINFTKGIFHPQSGWFSNTNSIYNRQEYKNKSAVIRFHTEDRPTKIFKGLGFYDLDNEFLDGEPRIFKSSITLGTDQIAYDCTGECDQAALAATDQKDIDDHDIHAGYRSNAKNFGKSLLNSDEYQYSFQEAKSFGSDSYCDNSANIGAFSCSYTTFKPGPYIPRLERKNSLRYNRGAGRNINTISVRLNYLNYANPKDLVVWFEIDPCGIVANRFCPPQSSRATNRWQFISKPIWNNNQTALFSNVPAPKPTIDIDNNKVLCSETDTKKKLPELYQQYIDALTCLNINADDNSSSPRCINAQSRLYLLNQDHIRYSDMHTKIIFSDNNILNTFSDNNNIGSIIDVDQNISTALRLAPTLTAPIYNDYKNQAFKNLLINNRLLTPDLRFIKFNSLPIFTPAPVQSDLDPPPPPPPANSDRTTFNLCIAIMNESDTISVYDRIMATDFLVGNQSSYNREVSTISTNSLCSWDLIIGDKDYSGDGIMSKILYKYNRNQSYKLPKDGYSFIADFTTKKYLIPPVNINAPYSNTMDSKKCKYGLEKLNVPRYAPPEPLNIPLFVFMSSFTLAGMGATMISVESSLSQQAQAIVDWLSKERQNRIDEFYNREIRIPSYNNYSFGEPDKALINISKNGDIWYKLEATMFKYNNCPIIRPKKYKYVTLGWDGLLRPFSIFGFNKFSNNITDIFDEGLIKKIYIDSQDNTDLSNFVTDTLYVTADTTYDAIIETITAEKLLENIQSLNDQISTILNQDPDTNPITEEQEKDLKKMYRGLNHYNNTMSSIGYQLEDGDTIELVDQSEPTEPPDPNIPETPRPRKIYTLYGYDKTVKEIVKFRDLLYINNFVSNNNIFNNLFFGNNALQDLPAFETVPTDPQQYETFMRNKRYKQIILDGLRPYNFFQRDDDVDMFSEKIMTEAIFDQIKNIDTQIRALQNTRSSQSGDALKALDQQISLLENNKWLLSYDKTTNKIVRSGWVKITNKYYTILELNTVIEPKVSIISKNLNNSKTYFVYKDDMTTIYKTIKTGKNNKDELIPFNIWPNNTINMKNATSAPEDNVSTFGAGSYGTGSPLVRPYKISDIKDVAITNPLIQNDFRNTVIKEDVNCFGYNYQEINKIISSAPYSILDDTDGIVSSIMSLNKNKTFIKNNNEYQFFDVRDEALASDLFTTTYPANTIYDGYVDYGLEKILLMNKFNAAQVAQLYARLNAITANINQLKIDVINYQRTASAIPSTIDLALNSVKLLPQNLDKKLKLLLHEYYEILYYLEMCGAKDISTSETNRVFQAYSGIQSDEPHIMVNFAIDSSNTDIPGRILFTEAYNEKYWINIDPEQSCSLDKEATVKILESVEYDCLDKNRIDVPKQISAPPDFVGFTWIDNVEHEGMTVQDFRTITGHVKYTITDQKLDQEKAKYPNISSWSRKGAGSYSVERKFFINNLGGSINSFITATYTYIVPDQDTERTNIPVDSSVETKVYNIFNLDNVNQLKVKFKRIPRKLKDADTNYDVYVPNQFGQLTKGFFPAPGGPNDSNMKIWKCFDRITKQDIPLPNYYVMLNEMVFRSFFGSADAAEHGGKELSESKEDNGWIPYG